MAVESFDTFLTKYLRKSRGKFTKDPENPLRKLIWKEYTEYLETKWREDMPEPKKRLIDGEEKTFERVWGENGAGAREWILENLHRSSPEELLLLRQLNFHQLEIKDTVKEFQFKSSSGAKKKYNYSKKKKGKYDREQIENHFIFKFINLKIPKNFNNRKKLIQFHMDFRLPPIISLNRERCESYYWGPVDYFRVEEELSKRMIEGEIKKFSTYCEEKEENLKKLSEFELMLLNVDGVDINDYFDQFIEEARENAYLISYSNDDYSIAVDCIINSQNQCKSIFEDFLNNKDTSRLTNIVQPKTNDIWLRSDKIDPHDDLHSIFPNTLCENLLLLLWKFVNQRSVIKANFELVKGIYKVL